MLTRREQMCRCKHWKDGWIINLGKPEFSESDPLDVRTLDNWHCDGDWFTHYLDSPEQALLVIPLFTDIKPKGGGTVICTDGIKLVAERLVRSSSPFRLMKAISSGSIMPCTFTDSFPLPRGRPSAV